MKCQRCQNKAEIVIFSICDQTEREDKTRPMEQNWKEKNLLKEEMYL